MEIAAVAALDAALLLTLFVYTRIKGSAVEGAQAGERATW